MVFLGILIAITVCIYLISFVYFALKDPDALRSERFTLEKMAINKGIVGDDTTGIIDAKAAELGEEYPITPVKKGPDRQ